MSRVLTVIGLETSCDETAVGVVRDGVMLSNVMSSQVDEHARFGGVVPEVAARAHVEAIRSLTHRALRDAGIHQLDVDAVAATRGPGLVGALMVGFAYGKALAWAMDKPFIGVDHMEGHLFAPTLEHAQSEPPAIVLLASGGHTQIVHARAWGEYETVGETIDDAAGEAFDKVARFLGMGFPGGPAIDRASDGGNPAAIDFPRALADRPTDLSFSGLKTAVVTYVRKHHGIGDLPPMADVAAAVQEAIVDVLVTKNDECGRRDRGRGRWPGVVACWPIAGCAFGSPRHAPREASRCICLRQRCAPTTVRWLPQRAVFASNAATARQPTPRWTRLCDWGRDPFHPGRSASRGAAAHRVFLARGGSAGGLGVVPRGRRRTPEHC